MSIYLDNGATSFPKPKSVEQAVLSALNDYKGSSSRSSSKEIHTLEHIIYDTRLLIARLFNFEYPDHVVFTKNVTEGLNLFFFGYLKQDDHVIMSALEHNAVARPLEILKKLRNIRVSVVSCDLHGQMNLEELDRLLKEKPKLVVVTHASNVSGDIQNLTQVSERTNFYNVPLLVDVAQTAGLVPIDMKNHHIDVVAFTGHKSLYGPQGIGGLVMTPEIAKCVEPLIYGGTGSNSENLKQPEIMPDKFESGTPNSLGILGLKAGIEFVKAEGILNILNKENKLIAKLQTGIENLDKVQLIGNPNPNKRVGILSVNYIGKDNAIIAHELSAKSDVITRVGLHCAPLAHQSYGTYPHGTIRLSTSAFTTEEDIEKTIFALRILKHY